MVDHLLIAHGARSLFAETPFRQIGNALNLAFFIGGRNKRDGHLSRPVLHLFRKNSNEKRGKALFRLSGAIGGPVPTGGDLAQIRTL
jgi:hypothetical protein